MSQWETIRDRSSHVSPVRLIHTKNHMNAQDDGIYQAVSRSFITLTRHDKTEKSEIKSRPNVLKLTLSLLLLCLLILFFWQCYTQKQSIYRSIDTILCIQKLQYIQRVISPQVTRLVSHVQTWANIARQCFYDLSNIIQVQYKEYISPAIISKVDFIKEYVPSWRIGYDTYVNHKLDWAIIKKEIKRTEDWIQEYIHPEALSTMVKMLKEAVKRTKEIVKREG